MNSILSSYNRRNLVQKLATEEFDIVVIGGGITGAGIALDASSRGFKVALIEKQDFAAGTSSRSTKLIHGGLRYLKQFEFKLVKEVGRERAIVYKNAPHLVVPEKMLLPLIQGGTFGYSAASFGLLVYDLLAGVRRSEWRKMLSKAETEEKEPLLRKDKLKGGGLYAEYRTDDARLTLEVMKTSTNYDSTPVNYTEVVDLNYVEGKVVGVKCKDMLSEQTYNVKGNYIVNAAGPWVDTIRKTDKSLKGKRLHLTKGVHLVLPREKFPISQSVYCDISDGRMMFAIPRGKITYLGTTDTNYKGKIEDPETTKEDAVYLIDAVNEMFPSLNLSINDIVSSWAGLRPLIHMDGKSPSELSRKDEIFVSETGLISMAGGKLTGYRKMAQRVTNLIAKDSVKGTNEMFVWSKTRRIVLRGGEFKRARHVPKYIDDIYSKIKVFGLSELNAEYLVRTYGKQTEVIINKIEDFNDTDPEVKMARAELWFSINNESVQRLQDFFIRRTGRLFFDILSINKLMMPILNDMEHYLDWSEERSLAEKEDMQMYMKKAIGFKQL